MKVSKKDVFLGLVGVSLVIASVVVVSNVLTTPSVSTVSTVAMSAITTVPTVTNSVSGIKVKVTKLSPSKSRIVEINSEIGKNMLEVSNQLRRLDNGEPVYLLLNSPGGSVFDGAQVISQMESMKSPVYTVCTGLCASMAFIIHQYGTKRYGLNRSILMAHPASSGLQGQIPNMLSQVSFLQRYVDKFNLFIANRSGINHDEFERMVSYETWIDAEDALSKNLLDNIVSMDIELNGPSPMMTNEQKRNKLIDLTM